MPSWGPYARLFLLEQNRSTGGGFFQFMVALCLENSMGIRPGEPLTEFVVESSFIEADYRTGWYFQHLPEDSRVKRVAIQDR